jgi:hypothetical protein
MRAAGLLEEARALEKGGDGMVPRVRQAAREAAMRRTGGTPLVCTVIERARAFAAVEASGSAAVTCCEVEGDQPGLAYVAARDAAYVALRDRVDLDWVVARLRCSALALVDGITMGQVPDAPPNGLLGGDTPCATNGKTGRTGMPDASEPTAATVPRNGIVVPGSRVRVRDTDGEHEYTMVTRATAGAPPECVSIGSPVGSALLGRRPGEQVRVQTPSGVRLLTVVDVAAMAAPSCAESVGAGRQGTPRPHAR